MKLVIQFCSKVLKLHICTNDLLNDNFEQKKQVVIIKLNDLLEMTIRRLIS